MCHTRILCSREIITISQCMSCGVLYIWHQNVFLNFTPDKFKAFRSAVNKLNEGECSFPFPDGEDRVIISTPVQEINFAFTFEEMSLFREALDEAVYMQEVYALMV